MSQSLRACLAATVILGCILGFTWFIQTSPGDVWTWSFRIGSVLAVSVPGGLLIWGKTLKDKAPDLLARISRDYFERDGFCFLIVPEVIEGVLHMVIYCQNRYQSPCEATVYLRPTKEAFKNVSGIPEFTLHVACQDGEFGRALKPWTPPDRLQGKTVLWDVGANVKYPKGRGTLLRLRDGKRVGQISPWIKAAGAMVGHFIIESPARVKLSLPRVVSSAVPEEKADWQIESIWKVGDRL